ncbi:MAG TPA: LAGLIDADG family homing endonuclease [Actinomycetota bacterium]|nr:LAGLIDADG family homing endonuclease [Actinomycetota bacterium]
MATKQRDVGVARTGLRFRRYFTREGIHPFDEVEWEVRDAVIPNYKEGGNAFEQRGVEFPKSWSQNATNIVAQKYFRGPLGTPQRESSVRQLISRVVDTIRGWGEKDGYFATAEDARIFAEELAHLLVNQKAAFNSPVWFNVGVPNTPQQCSACFILSVEDTMTSILNWYVEEGIIFKGGSGAGVNLSRIRSSKEPLAGGGTASGPVSFMRGADASAGTIKSGGKTRRAAKMVILNVDHPDIRDFIWCKAIEERKARVLRDAGFDMDLDGRDSHSIQYQNANNSVRVTDEFMRAYLEDRDWKLKAVLTGEPIETVRARDLMREIAQAAWECADPGMQYDTTINEWHTCPASGRINASNPCFTGDSRVHTDKGLIRFRDLVRRVLDGESFEVYTHDLTNPDAPRDRVRLSRPTQFMVTGVNEVLRLRFSDGRELRCTPNHRIWTSNRGYVRAEELTTDDEVPSLGHATPSVLADHRLPVPTEWRRYAVRGDWSRELQLPEKWDEELAHLLGWLVGDGSISGDVVTTVYGSREDQEEILPRHRELLTRINGGRSPKPSVQANGTVQLRLSRRPLARFFEALGVKAGRAAEKEVPWSVFEAPADIQRAFLRGLFDADGCVTETGRGSRYVGLGSRSRELLRGVQMLLSTLGIASRIYDVTGDRGGRGFTYTRKRDGATVRYEDHGGSYDLRISGDNIPLFLGLVGFTLSRKQVRLGGQVQAHRFRDGRTSARLVGRERDGFELTYNLTEPINHSYIVDGTVVANCSEYMHLDNSACNLASLNLMKFLDEEGNFDVPAFKHAVEIVFTAQEIIVGNSDYPTDAIARNAKDFRQLGLGYANLGALLMARGLPYDSDAGRAWAGAITALMTGWAYRTSARIAEVMGPFAGFPPNRDAMLRVMRKHRAAADEIDAELVPEALLSAAKQAWDEAIALGEQHGYRNAQATVLAPTGCLVGGTLVPTEQGLVRLETLGDPAGPRWQPLGIRVATDVGPREATRFYVNGLEAVVTVTTHRGYRIRGTPRHRIKVVDGSGRWVWKRFSEIAPGDQVPLALDQLVGGPREVVLPPLPEARWTREHGVRVPRRMSPELAELLGYFMGDGSLHPRGIRLCVDSRDLDVVERLRILGKELFGLEAHVAERRGYLEVALHSVRLAAWWEACGFAKREPAGGHGGKGYEPHIPDAVLASNDPETYRAFLRGLFEADGSVAAGYPHWSTTSLGFSTEVQTLLLALGYPTTRKFHRTGWGDSDLAVLRILNGSYHARWLEEIGFIGNRKQAKVHVPAGPQGARQDRIPLTREMIDRLAPGNDRLRRVLLLEHGRTGSVPRRIAAELFARTGDEELGRLLRFFYDRVASAELGEDELTYDLSVPDNVTYVANGFVSHNTIGLMMDCDTTGIEPDLALVKTKKLVGGGTMQIVNQTVPRALERLGYGPAQIEDIVGYIMERNSVVGAPHLREEHYPVFDTSMGDRAIHYMGHVRMMAAVQPFISGAISKCVTGETLLTTEDGLVRIGSLHDGERPDSFRDHVMAVASLDGVAKTDAFYYGGVRPVREVVLRSGHRIVGTPNHRVLVAGDGGLAWRTLEEIDVGDHVAVRYGAEMWSPLPARLDGFVPSPPYGPQRAVRLPEEMTEELAFLLGAYASEGHVTRSNWTVTITNADEGVLARVADAWRSAFGLEPRVVRQPGKCPAVAVSSKAVVEFLGWLGCGARSAEKRIPDAVLRSPRPHVLAFLRGLSLDAYVSWMGRSPKWAICVSSPGLLDDLQAVLTNLGVVHSRISKRNARNGKVYDEVYATGEHAQRVIRLVGFVEEAKRGRAEEMLRADPGHSAADVVPGISPRELYQRIPRGRSGRRGHGDRKAFGFLLDARTRSVSRSTLERLARLQGVRLPAWIETVLREGLHFSPVERVADAGEREVFDVSVPGTHAFVANGVVNHNTVNMPEHATVEEVEQLFVEGWRLGLKAIAIYRDNCKVAQPLQAERKGSGAAAAPAGSAEPVRKRLPRSRPSRTISFSVGGAEGYITAGEYPDDGIGEIFLKVSKQGSTLSGVMDAFAIAVSLGLQYGVPLEAFVSKFVNMKFEPSGMTNDPDVRFASSLVDYVFRRLALDYLPKERREALGIRSVEERKAEIEGVGTNGGPAIEVPDPGPPAEPPVAGAPPQATGIQALDAPLCYACGSKMQPAGSCYVCPSCGSTSGCS